MVDMHFIPVETLRSVGLLHRICGDGAHGSGASYHYHAVLFGVEVEQDASADQACVKPVGARQSLLLVYGEERFDRTVYEVRIDHRRHGGGAAEAVVGSEGCAFGPDPVSLHYCLDGVGQEVVLHVAALLGHHVLMALEHYRRSVLMSRGGGAVHHYVAYLVGSVAQPVLLGPAYEEILHPVEMMGRAGHFRDFVETLPDELRLKVCYLHFFSVVFFSFLYLAYSFAIRVW